MTWIRNWNIKYSWMVRKYAYPENDLHCDVCGWYPQNGVWGLAGDTCCNLHYQPISQMQLTQFAEIL